MDDLHHVINKLLKEYQSRIETLVDDRVKQEIDDIEWEQEFKTIGETLQDALEDLIVDQNQETDHRQE